MYLVDLQLSHLLGCVGNRKKGRSDLVDLLVCGLCGQHHRNQQGVGVGVVERDWLLRVEFVEYLAGLARLLSSAHRYSSVSPLRPSAKAAAMHSPGTP